VSFSAMVADLASRAPEELPYAGLVDDDEDLSLRVEEVLARQKGLVRHQDHGIPEGDQVGRRGGAQAPFAG
jgi:hypothetical protein